MVLLSKIVSRSIYEVFWQNKKNKKTLKMGKIRNYDEEREFCRKKFFPFS